MVTELGAVALRPQLLEVGGWTEPYDPPRGFPNGVELVIDGAAHSDPLFLSSPVIGDVMVAIMKGQPLRATRLTVPPKFVPLE